MKLSQLTTILLFAPLIIAWQPAASIRPARLWVQPRVVLTPSSVSTPPVFLREMCSTAMRNLRMSDWNAATGSDFQFFVNSTSCDPTVNLPTSDNCVAFVSGSSINGALGVTTVSSLFGSILNTDVRFNVNVSWTSGLNVGDFTFGPPFSFRGVARHEFGHALGLCHEDRPVNVVLMNSVYTAGTVKPANLHWDDRAGARAIYPGAGTERDLIAYMWKKTGNGGAGCASSSTVSTPVFTIPGSARVGAPVTMEFSFENAGNLASGIFNIAFLMSTNNIISLGDTLIAENVGASAPAHSRGTFTRTANIPFGTPTGTFFLGICLDRTGTVSKSIEGNNCAVAPGSISISP